MPKDVPKPKRFFHGGPPGLSGYILPANQTGAIHASVFGEFPEHSPDKVYVCTHWKGAALFAAMVPRGVVYEVVPEGELVPDTDVYGWVIDSHRRVDFESFSCDRAKIVGAKALTTWARKRALGMLEEHYGFKIRRVS